MRVKPYVLSMKVTFSTELANLTFCAQHLGTLPQRHDPKLAVCVQ